MAESRQLDKSRQRSHITRNLVAVVLVLVAAYAVAGFLLLPWWLHKAVPEQLSDRLGWQAQVADVTANPFTLALTLDGVSAEQASGETVLRFERLLLDLNALELVQGVVGFDAIELEQPFVRLELLADQGLNLVRDWRRHNQAAESAEPAPADSSGLPKIHFRTIEVAGGELLFRDLSQDQPAEFQVTPINLALQDLATWARDSQDTRYAVSAAMGDQSLDWDGDLSLAPLHSRGRLRLENVDHRILTHFLGPYIPYDLRSGRISAQSDYEMQFGEFFYLVTRDGSLTLDDLAVAIAQSDDKARFTNRRLSAEQIQFDLNARQVSVGEVTVDALDLALARDANGDLDWLAPLTAAGEGKTQAPDNGNDPFRWSVEGLRLSDSRLHWQDRRPARPAELTLEQVSLSLGSFRHRLEEPVRYQAAASLASGGQLSLQGQLSPQPFTLESAIAGSDIALAAFEPYLPEGVSLSIGGGSVGLDGDLNLDGQQAQLTGTFSGSASIDGLAVRLPGEDSRLVSWRSLRMAPIEYNVNPGRLEIGSMTLTEPQVNLVRAASSGHNLARVLGDADGGQPPAVTSDNEDAGFIFRINQLAVERGALAYTDRTLTPPFSTSLDELNGSITGLSNIPPQQAKLSMRGRVDSVAELDFQGTLGTLGTDNTSALQLTMKDLSLPSLSPFLGPYLGYSIDAGKLDLTLDYQIVGSQIDASNLMVMDRPELGEPITSDQAVSAPIKLGLALLRDRDNVVEINIPVSGNLQDPNFSVAKVTMRAFVNVLVAAATSPFSVLGSIADLAGLSGEELGGVSFQPGSRELSGAESDKLAALAQALLDRPDLLLNIRGAVAAETDGLALLRQRVRADQGGALSEAQWQELKAAYLAGERDLAPELLTSLATARALSIRKRLADTHGVPAKQLYLLDPVTDAQTTDRGEVLVGFTLEAR